MSFILGIRKIRSGMNIAPGKPLPVLMQDGTVTDLKRLEHNRSFLLTLARLESITWLNKNDEAPESATSLVGDMKLLIPMAGLIDKEAELVRLDKELEKINKALAQCEHKLANPAYVERAPSHIVAREQQRLGELRATRDSLFEQKERIETL